MDVQGAKVTADHIVPIVFTFDEKFSLLFKVALFSLLKNADEGTFYKVYVLYCDIPEHEIENIQRVASGFGQNFSLDFVYFEAEKIKDFFSKAKKRRSNNISHYLKIFIPYLIPDHGKLLFSDADVIFLRDLNEIYQTELGDSCLGVVQFNHQKYFTSDVEFNDKYFATGNMIFNVRPYLEENILKKLIPFFNQYGHKQIYHDQDVFNYIFYDKVKYLDLSFCLNHNLWNGSALERYLGIHLTRYSNSEIENAINSPLLLHFTGPKPDVTIPCPKIWLDYCGQAGLLTEYTSRLSKR